MVGAKKIPLIKWNLKTVVGDEISFGSRFARVILRGGLPVAVRYTNFSLFLTWNAVFCVSNMMKI